jgi:hypothetical protein
VEAVALETELMEKLEEQVVAVPLTLTQLDQMEMLEGITQQKDKRAETQTLLQAVLVVVEEALHLWVQVKVRT